MSLSDAMNVAVSGLLAEEARLQKSASNLARSSEAAGKKEFIVITDRSYRDIVLAGTPTSQSGTVSPTGYQIGTGVQIVGNYLSFEQGERIQTGRSLDVYIDGNGFFEVTLPDGTLGYTRVGNLQTDNAGRLVMPGTGYPLNPNITFSTNMQDITINNVGEVYADVSGTPTLVGQIQTATFLNPSGLRRLGNGLFATTTSSGTANLSTPGSSINGPLVQGAYEGSNIQAVDEIVEMVAIEKSYNALTKVIKTTDECWKSVTQGV
ncbi:MAG: flagellar hook-basal body complex protein [Proteobacteria bacterium]|nr:flagellar hook-basal body complex protein [Pseudomonadota bacterium]